MSGKYIDPEYKRKHYLANKEKYKAKAKAWKEANPDKVKESSKKRYENKRDHILAVTTAYYNSLTPEERRARERAWRAKNPGKAAAFCAKRRTRISKQCPPWVDYKEIQGFYEMAARVSACLGIKHHVDHIYPLKGKTSRGLHVPWNLRVIPATINHKKHNKLPEEFKHGRV